MSRATTRKRKRKAAPKPRCPFRKGDRIVHLTLGELDVAATKKVGPKRWQLAVVSDDGLALTIPVDANIRKA